MIYRFGPCELDLTRHRLLRDGEAIHVEPQVFQLIELLVSRTGDLVTRDEIIEVVWQGRIVSEAAISSRINAARAAVGDDGRRQALIRTVTRRGFQLAVPVEAEGITQPALPDPHLSERSQRIRMTRSRDGAGIAWAVSGDGPPLLRAGHWLSHLDLDWDSPVWAPLLDRLGRGRQLIRYDQRGTGLSDRDAGPPTLETLTDDMEAVANAAGIDRFVIYAVSQSVPVAVNFAVRHPERVRGMVLHAGFAVGDVLRDPDAVHMTETFLHLIRNGWGKPGSAFMTALSSLFMPGATAEQTASMIEMQIASASAETAARLREAIGKFDVSHLLGQVRSPVLVSHGREDAVQPFSEGQRLAQGIPGAEFIALDTAAHVILPEHPAWAKMLTACDRFISELP